MSTASDRPLPTIAGLDTGRILAATAELGDYFAIRRADSRGWHTYSQLIDPTVMSQFVDEVRSAIAGSTGASPERIPARLAASSFQLGVAARLLSPIVGSATLFGVVPLLAPDSVVWRRENHSPIFAMTGLDWAKTPGPADAARIIAMRIAPALFGSLNEILRTTASLSPRVSWGNVVSAANGAVTVLALSHPHLERTGRSLVRALLDTERFADTGDFTRGAFTRNSCCLFYQLPGSGLCGDCVLASSPGSRRQLGE
ncbi:MAG: (2Fe-2S)-binding protein [Actinobacteria bacterium]|nr:(2Fe-2S)-binding protein [Actinomycetota bacterium]